MAPTAASALAQGGGYRVDDLIIDVGRQRVMRGDTELAFSALSFELLLALVREAPNVVSVDTLMAHVWPGLVVGPETVSQRVKLVRDALGDDAEKPRYIAGVRGRGYRMLARVTRLPDRAIDEAATVPGEHASLWTRLRARGVLRVAASYAVIASLLVQLASIVVPTYGLPNWLMVVLLSAAIIGFPIAVALAWFFEMTPEGTVLDLKADALPRPRVLGLRRYADILIIAVLAIVVAYLLVEREPDSVVVRAPRTVAVLPFVNLTGDASQDYFSDGLSDTLIHFLSRAEGLKVIARTSSFQFKDKSIDIREVGAKLGADAVLEGSVQRGQDRIRVIAQLVNAKDGSHYWSKTFDRRPSDIFAIQDQIGNEVLTALQVSILGVAPRSHAATARNLAAYESYLLGRQQLERRTNESLHDALRYFERAIELDPSFALAHSGVADAVLLLTGRDEIRKEKGWRRAEQAIDRALALDPKLGAAYASRGGLEDDRDRHAEAEAAFHRAIELEPSNVHALNWYVGLLEEMARMDEAEQVIRRAIEIDPLSPPLRYRFVDFLMVRGQKDEALRELLWIVEIDPLFARAYSGIGVCYEVGRDAWRRRACQGTYRCGAAASESTRGRGA